MYTFVYLLVGFTVYTVLFPNYILFSKGIHRLETAVLYNKYLNLLQQTFFSFFLFFMYMLCHEYVKTNQCAEYQLARRQVR